MRLKLVSGLWCTYCYGFVVSLGTVLFAHSPYLPCSDCPVNNVYGTQIWIFYTPFSKPDLVSGVPKLSNGPACGILRQRSQNQNYIFSGLLLVSKIILFSFFPFDVSYALALFKHRVGFEHIKLYTA